MFSLVIHFQAQDLPFTLTFKISTSEWKLGIIFFSLF